MKKLQVDGADIRTTDEAWNGLLPLPAANKTGEAKLWYYRKPTYLDPLNLEQVPDIDPRYFHTIGQYAAEMYYRADDDEDMREAFTEKFFEGITYYKKSSGTVTNFKNVW
jgi:hypothetical protein